MRLYSISSGTSEVTPWVVLTVIRFPQEEKIAKKLITNIELKGIIELRSIQSLVLIFGISNFATLYLCLEVQQTCQFYRVEMITRFEIGLGLVPAPYSAA
jgi:hypothetical protein